MKIDPAFCQHTKIKRTAKVETLSVPELGIEQLVIRVKVYCGDCKESFIPKTMNEGFSTGEVSAVDNEVFIPLEHPQIEEIEYPDLDVVDMAAEKQQQVRSKEHLH